MSTTRMALMTSSLSVKTRSHMNTHAFSRKSGTGIGIAHHTPIPDQGLRLVLRRPRLWRARSFSERARLQVGILASEGIPGQPLANNRAHGQIETITVFHLAVVIAPCLLIEI